MDKEQILEELELADGVVRGLDSLLSFESADADAQMSCVDHVDIVGSITDRKSSLSRIALLDHKDDFGLLLGAHSACKYNIGTLAKINESCQFRLAILNETESLTCDNHCVLTHFLCLALLPAVPLDVVRNLLDIIS